MSKAAARLVTGPPLRQGETHLCAMESRRTDSLAGPRSSARPGVDAAGEAGLLRDVVSGSQAAFQRLVGLHAPGALAVARRMLGDEAEAEDVVQEALLRLWHNAGSIDVGPAGIRPWLRRVVSNLAIDRIRSGKATVVTDEVPEQAAPADQDRALEARDTAGRIEAALAALPERQRLALTLFHYEGASQNETAEIMGISAEAVESLLARARRALKAALEHEWRDLLPEVAD